MKRYSVTIIGMGPRGLTLLERIASVARARACQLQINLIEPGECGPGGHAPRLPPHLMCSSAAGDLTIFPAHTGAPSLAQWARREGYRRVGGELLQMAAGSEAGEEVADADCLSRALLGSYLAWAYRSVVSTLPCAVRLCHLRHRAIDMFQQPDGSFVIELDSGFTLPSDFVFLATGHGRNNLTDEEAWCRKFAQDHARYNSKLAYLRHAAPLERLVALGSDAEVGIQGMGLSAHEVVAELTLGRGGRFVASGTGLRYRRSGLEPRLTLFSRSCLPPLARPDTPDGAVAGPAHFLTSEAVQALRQQAKHARASSQLDFDRDLLPLLWKELAWAWRRACMGAAPSVEGFTPSADEQKALESMLFPLRARSVDTGAEPGAFSTFFACLLADDLGEARRGSLHSPAKAAAAALAAARAVLQQAIEHGGLTAGSHRKFLSVYHPAFNRVAGGPSSEHNERWLALMEAGLLTVVPGPNPAVRIDEDRSQFALHTRVGGRNHVAYLDALVVARRDHFSPETDESVFIGNLLKRGTVRPYYNGAFHPGGIDVDAAGHPVSRSGRVYPNLWALGCLTEGVHYFTHALPAREGNDAERCVTALFDAIAEPPQAARALAPRSAPLDMLL